MISMAVDFSLETVEARRRWDIFKVLKENNYI